MLDIEIERRKKEMGAEWEIKDVGETEYFLGMWVQQDLKRGIIRLTQRPYWEHVLNCFELQEVLTRNTPLPVGPVLDNNMLDLPRPTQREWTCTINRIELFSGPSCGGN